MAPCCGGYLTVIFFSNKKKIPMRFRDHRAGRNIYTNQVFYFQNIFVIFFLLCPPPPTHTFILSLLPCSVPYSQCTCLLECIRVERSSICAFQKSLQLTSTERLNIARLQETFKEISSLSLFLQSRRDWTAVQEELK